MEAILLSEEQYKDLVEQFNSIKLLIKEGQRIKQDTLYDNATFLKLMGISKKTAQTWRDNGLITFSQISGKIYYRQKDILDMLERNAKPAFKSGN